MGGTLLWKEKIVRSVHKSNRNSWRRRAESRWIFKGQGGSGSIGDDVVMSQELGDAIGGVIVSHGEEHMIASGLRWTSMDLVGVKRRRHLNKKFRVGNGL
ncbi:unnamed protein product [Cochlearia groenlandica]